MKASRNGAISPVRVVTYNIRHGRGVDNRVDLRRVSAALLRTGGDLIGLQEVDRHVLRSRFCDQAKNIGHALGTRHVFGAALRLGPFGRYGNAILSRWPVGGFNNHLLPGRGERRGLLEAEIGRGGIKLGFFCTHLGLRREDRLLQVRAILEVLKAKDGPAILVGDFNTDRSSPEYRLLSGALRDATAVSGGFATYPAQSPSAQIDFVFVSRHWEVLSSGPVVSEASDHLAVVCEIFLA